MLFFGKSPSILGLDIGTSYVKAVQLKHTQDKAILESYGLVNVVYPTASSVKFDAVKQTAEIIQSLCEKSRFTARKAVVSVPSNVAFVSVLNFPPMHEKEIQKSVEYQAKKYIPLPMSDVSLGWQILDESQSLKTQEQKNADPKIKVLLTAVPRNVINNYMKVVEMAGLQVAALEIESLSLIRSLVSQKDQGEVLIIDIGAKSTILSLVHNGYLLASRHLTLGGDTITASVASSMGISLERADQMKRSVVFGGAEISPAAQIAKNILELVKNEVQQFIRMTENQSKKIGKIILTGGGSKLPGIDRELQTLVSKVEFGNPLSKIIFDPALENKLSILAPQLSVAVGLALRNDF